MKVTGKRELCFTLFIVVASCIVLGACSSSESSIKQGQDLGYERNLSDPNDLSPIDFLEGEKMRVVATTSIIADVVSNVGGEAVELITLMPANVDPHSYEPTPADLRSVSEAHVVFINGLGLEEFIEEMLHNAGGEAPVISLSDGIDSLAFSQDAHSEEVGFEGSDEEHVIGTYDPHVWFDPANVMIWVDRISLTLSILDPEKKVFYEENGEGYKEALIGLDGWIEERVSQVPEGDRLLVTDHKIFGYFASRYGFDVVGAVIPVYSSAAEPSAREIAELEERVRDLRVKVIFVGVTINTDIAETIVQDTGIQLVPLYTGSLSDLGGPAGSYIALMRYNVGSIVSALLD